MPSIGQSDIVAKAILVFLAIMLFSSVYLTLIKAMSLSCRAYRARKFLRGLAHARSLQQVQALVDKQSAIDSFSRLSHCIMVEKKNFEATATKYRPDAGMHGAMARRLIEDEAAGQEKDLHQGLNVLVAIAWVAPLAGLLATAWRAVWLWLQSDQAHWPAGFALMQFGLAVAMIALLAYLGLALANRAYLSKFALFARMVMPMLEQGGEVSVRDAKPRHGFPRVWRDALDTDV